MDEITYFEFDDINQILKNEFYSHLLDHFNCIRRYNLGHLVEEQGKQIIEMNDEIEAYVEKAMAYVNNILSCIQSIDIAIVSIKDMYDRPKYDWYKISFVNYAEYHYEMFNNKVSTIRDILHRLIKHVYKLDIIHATYKAIFEDNPQMKKEPLFSTYDKLREVYNKTKKHRNKANHEGDFKIDELGELNIFESTRLFGKESPYYKLMDVERNSTVLRLRQTSKLLTKMYKIRNELLKVVLEFLGNMDKPFMEHITYTKNG